MNTKQLTDRLELILECLVGSCTSNTTGEDQLDDLITELKAKNNEVLDLVSYRFDVPNDVIGCAYYSDDAYYDHCGYYMLDQDGNKVRPDEKYLVVK